MKILLLFIHPNVIPSSICLFSKLFVLCRVTEMLEPTQPFGLKAGKHPGQMVSPSQSTQK